MEEKVIHMAYFCIFYNFSDGGEEGRCRRNLWFKFIINFMVFEKVLHHWKFPFSTSLFSNYFAVPLWQYIIFICWCQNIVQQIYLGLFYYLKGRKCACHVDCHCYCWCQFILYLIQSFSLSDQSWGCNWQWMLPIENRMIDESAIQTSLST